MGAASPFLNVTASGYAKTDDQSYCVQLFLLGQANLGQDQEGEIFSGLLWYCILCQKVVLLRRTVVYAES